MFRKMPLILLSVIILSVFANIWLPVFGKSFFYSLALTLKEIIIFILPFLVFGLLFKTASQLSKKASKVVLYLLGAVCVSSFVSMFFSYFIGHFAFQLDLSMSLPSETHSLQPLWEISLPKVVGNDRAMFLGLFLGLFLGRLKPNLSEKISCSMEKAIGLFLKGFLSVIPLFILGFMIKMNHDQVMIHILRNYIFIFGLIFVSVFSYIILIYFAVNRFDARAAVRSLKNMFPAAFVGFGSMSSAAALPLSMIGSEKNANNPSLVRSFIPATVNIHLIGDCFATPIFAFAILKNFAMVEPSFLTYFIFAAYFVLAKFSVAAVPGGGILVMLPVLESVLGFNAPMLSLITALYVLFDPVITCANVLGNGGFAMVLDRLTFKSKKIV